VIAFGLVLAACSGQTETADTDCVSPEMVADQVRFASIVLLGTATEWDGTTAQFEIEEIWRGPDLPVEVEVVPEPGRAYSPGVRYLLFPTDSSAPLADAPCSATSRWDESLAEFRPAGTRVPGTTPAEDADLPWEWVLAAIVLGGVWLAVRRVQERRHPEPPWNPDATLADDG